MADITGMIDPKIFEDLQTKIDEDAEVRDQIKAILQTLERQCRNAQSVLSRAHSTPAAHCMFCAYFSSSSHIDNAQCSLFSNLQRKLSRKKSIALESSQVLLLVPHITSAQPG